MSVYDTLKQLNITLPPVAVPAAAYVPFVQSGSLVFLSGHIARKDGQVWTGKLGETLGTADGQAAARAVAIDLLGTLQAACGGDLNRVQRIVKV
ncbi:MAG: RidA family protein, partial [Burkholderiaceae bacterium]|nr:RidA family protein [Burkholderiaceae bacterium]